MQTVDERTNRVLARTSMLRQRSQRRMTSILSGMSACLAVVLMALIVSYGGLHEINASGESAALLLEGAGGYVLVAVVAFSIAVVATVLIMRNQEKLRKSQNDFPDEHVDEEENKQV